MALGFKKASLSLGMLLSVSFGAWADDQDVPPFTINGSFPYTIQTNGEEEQSPTPLDESAQSVTGSKTISLMSITPSARMIEKTTNALRRAPGDQTGPTDEMDYSTGIIPFSQSKGAVDLGMNSVPVLDQGQYGTCVTFASTAAMDAVLGVGDYIDQQCTLELNTALGNNYWDGAYYASEIIDPLKKYGVVQKGRCNANYASRYTTITLKDYATRSSKTVDPSKISYLYNGNIALADVKKALSAGHRVAIGFMLMANQDPVSVQGFNTKVGGKSITGGLWACSQPSNPWSTYCGVSNSGHEVVVIGYDDAQQLLKIRNSWNTSVGDKGEFYMTYKFFSTMTGDGTEVY